MIVSSWLASSSMMSFWEWARLPVLKRQAVWLLARPWNCFKRKIYCNLFMIANDILNWYEASLPSQERKRRGHFSTPPLLVEQLLDACGYRPENDLSRLRVLDPACGSGNLLAGALHRLIASGKQAGHSEEEIAASVQRNLWGFDPDPIACFLAEMQLRVVLSTEQHPAPQQSIQEMRLQVAENELLRLPAAPLAKVPLHIHQADGLALAWEQRETVDLLLANPPYLAAKNNDLSGYRSAQQRGQADSYLLFLNLALQVVRPNGWIGLILPDPVLARVNATKERQHLLAKTTVHHLWHLSGVFSAYVGAAIIIAQKNPPRKQHQISWKRERWQSSPTTATEKVSSTKKAYEHSVLLSNSPKSVAQAHLHQQPGAELRYLLSEVQETLVGRLQACLHQADMHNEPGRLVPLRDLVTIRRGEELSKNSPLLNQSGGSNETEWYPVLRGGVDMRPYGVPVARCWIAREQIMKPLEPYLAPKLLVVKSTGHLQAALDLQGHVVLQTLYLLNLRAPYTPVRADSLQQTQNEDELYFLLALLNSRLLR